MGLLGFVFFLLIGVAPAFSERLVVIVNERSSLFSVKMEPTLEDLREVCRGNVRFWGSDSVKAVNQRNRKALEPFVEEVCGMGLSEYQNFWVRKSLSEGVRPPPSFDSSAEVIRHVQKERGGIGYVFESEAAGVAGIKTIHVISIKR